MSTATLENPSGRRTSSTLGEGLQSHSSVPPSMTAASPRTAPATEDRSGRIGRLAIQQFLPALPLVEQIGKSFAVARGRRRIDVIPLPHPSGASTWPRSEPGKSLTAQALKLLGRHAAWQSTFPDVALSRG